MPRAKKKGIHISQVGHKVTVEGGAIDACRDFCLAHVTGHGPGVMMISCDDTAIIEFSKEAFTDAEVERFIEELTVALQSQDYTADEGPETMPRFMRRTAEGGYGSPLVVH